MVLSPSRVTSARLPSPMNTTALGPESLFPERDLARGRERHALDR